MIKNLLCKLNIHDDDLEEIVIQPILYDKYRDRENLYLRAREGHLWRCSNCKREKIIG